MGAFFALIHMYHKGAESDSQLAFRSRYVRFVPSSITKGPFLRTASPTYRRLYSRISRSLKNCECGTIQYGTVRYICGLVALPHGLVLRLRTKYKNIFSVR